jgi:hypothetical protein
MKEPRMARPEDRLAAIRAYKQGKLGFSWGTHETPWFYWRDFAKRQGWSLPLFFGKRAFIAKMLESDENFETVLVRSSIDVYIPAE